MISPTISCSIEAARTRNRIVGEWDEGKLAELLKDLIANPSLDLDLTGFDSEEIDHVLANVTTTEGLANDDAAFDGGNSSLFGPVESEAVALKH